jgi:UDP-N-acetylmuramate--alanine ligase
MTDGKSYFFVGVGGSGMMPLAMILAGQGARVAGSDRTLDQGRLAAKFGWLHEAGISLYPQDGSGITSSDQIVVASAAVEETVPDIVAANRVGAMRMTRAELLAQLFNAAPLPIGVAGTSGKSTVTGMIGWILHAVGLDPTVMNGAVMKNFASPQAPFASALVGRGDAFVSEVDESDGSIALYRPRIAVLNNVSIDHKSLEELRALFGDFIGRAETAVVNLDNGEGAALAMAVPAERRLTFAIEGEADLVAEKLAPEPFGISFEVVARSPSPFRRFAPPSLSRWEKEGAREAQPSGKGEGDERHSVRLQVPGRHNVSNALAAIGACVAAGVPLADAADAIGGFIGLRRRMDLVGEANGVAVIDDFGHNPDKIAATLDTLHAFPGRLLILFQPHGYGPLKVMRRELVASFVERLGRDDLLVLPDPVYHGGTVAREVTSADIVTDIAATGARALHIADREAAAAHLVAEARPGDRIVVMGARDDTLSTLAAEMLARL